MYDEIIQASIKIALFSYINKNSAYRKEISVDAWCHLL